MADETTLPLYLYNPSEVDRQKTEDRRRSAGYQQKCAGVKFFTLEQICTSTEEFWPTEDSDDIDGVDYKKLDDEDGTIVKLFRFIINKSELKCGLNNRLEQYSHLNMADDGGVFSASEFGIDQTGKLRYVSNKTGHYRVPSSTLNTVVYPYLISVMGYTLKEIEALYEQPIAGIASEELEELSHEEMNQVRITDKENFPSCALNNHADFFAEKYQPAQYSSFGCSTP